METENILHEVCYMNENRNTSVVKMGDDSKADFNFNFVDMDN